MSAKCKTCGLPTIAEDGLCDDPCQAGPQHTPLPWDYAADSYGKVRHSKKACVFATVKGTNGERLVNVAQRIENWKDAAFIIRACNAHEELKAYAKEMHYSTKPTHADVPLIGCSVCKLIAKAEAEEAKL